MKTLPLPKMKSKLNKNHMLVLLICASFTLILTAAAANKGRKMLLDQKTTLLNGKDINLNQYAGKVILFVNTASYCGYTSQYKELQELHERYEKEGFTVIAIPCNNFGNQEPGSGKEIQTFLDNSKFNISFPILSKRNAVGDSKSELFDSLLKSYAKQSGTPLVDIGWNFEKFLVNRKQEVVARFKSSVGPMDGEVLKAIELALKDR